MFSSGTKALNRLRTTVLHARHPLKRILRNRSVLGVSFPDVATTIQTYLEPVDREIYRVRQNRNGRVTRSGVVRVGGRFLSLDYGSFGALHPTHLGSMSPALHFPAVLPLWSHSWSTYYHWLIDIAPKLAAAKQFFGDSAVDLVFLYPGELRPHEIETVESLGLSTKRVINVCRTGGVAADTIYAMPLPGFYRVNPRLEILRSLLCVQRQPSRRIYLARGGRRRVHNEDDLFTMLQMFGFEFIADVPRPLAAQIELFAEAAYIVAPHGAGLSNLIWSSSAAQVLELGSAKYSPDWFKILAAECGIGHNRLIFGSGVTDYRADGDDFIVDVNSIRSFITQEWSL